MAEESNPFQSLETQATGGAIELPFTRTNGKATPGGKAGQNEGSMSRAARVIRKVKASYSKVRAWQAQARECQRMYDGHQWEDFDKMLMTQQKRPVLVYNEIRKVIRGITGLERLNRTDVRFKPPAVASKIEEDASGDLATEAVAMVDEVSEAIYERSLIVKDLANCGMGWLEVRVDFTEDLDGVVCKERVPWSEMFWDTNAKATGLRDTEWRCRKREMPKDKFEKRWPDMVDLVDMMEPEPPEWTINKYELVTPNYSLANQRANPEVDAEKAGKNTIAVYQFQERYDATIYRMADPENPDKLMEVSEKLWKDLKADLAEEGLPPPAAVRQTKTKYRQLYVANGLELEDPVDLPGNYWTLLVTTGEWDEEKKMFTGIVPDMISPQQTKNKSLSNSVDFYLNNAKGGVMFEQNAFMNETRAKAEWTKVNAWVPLKEGGLNKVKQRDTPPIPTGLQGIFDISTKSVTDVIGLGPEFFGQAEADTGDPTRQGRMAAALAIFGWFFDELSRFRKEEARVTLGFVKEFMTDGQLIEIGGPFNAKSIPLLKEKLPDKYSMSIDDSVKHNPNLKAKIWQDLTPMIPSLMRYGAGKFLIYALKFSPFPAELVDMIQKDAAQQQGQQQGQQQQKGKKEDPAVTQAKVQKMGADTMKSMAQARALDLEGKAKMGEMYIDALKVSADLKDKHTQAKMNTIEILQALVPGLAKGSSNGEKSNGQNKTPAPQQVDQ